MGRFTALGKGARFVYGSVLSPRLHYHTNKACVLNPIVPAFILFYCGAPRLAWERFSLYAGGYAPFDVTKALTFAKICFSTTLLCDAFRRVLLRHVAAARRETSVARGEQQERHESVARGELDRAKTKREHMHGRN